MLFSFLPSGHAGGYLESSLPQGVKQKMFALIENRLLLWGSAILIVTFIILGVIRYRNANPKLKAVIILCFFGLVSCILFISMWYDESTSIINDRYYYLPAIFFCQILSCAIFYNKKLFKTSCVLTYLYMVYCIAGTLNVVWKYRIAAKVQIGIINNYRWQNSDTVLLLNLPNNYKGVHIIPSAQEEFFNKNYKAFKGQSLRSKIYDVASYNIHDRWDGAHVIVIDSLNLKVTPNHYGSWWHMNRIGAVDYENELYKFHIFDGGFTYILTFRKKPSPNMKILLQSGESWKEVDMEKLNVEQW